ncbi:MAG: DEAD/DEAH box helicase [Candidatus Altiarchaeota archaeon]|nr:DEAD/DEAH box helicase [Candidatus Altiarchaeota archaeon]
MLKIKPRLYQEKILSTAIKGNTLVVLPTGLGKTLIAIMLGMVRQKKGKILIMSPTKPLVEQHAKTIEDISGIGPQVLHGTIGFEKRKKLWDADWIVATPQTVQRDILRGIDISRFSLLVFDEAHRATGEYAYTHIAKYYIEKTRDPLILALTASPGGKTEKIDEVMRNLSIQQVEVRTEDDPDVRPYVKEKFLNWTPVNLKSNYQITVSKVKDVLRKYVRELKSMGYLKSADLSTLRKRDLLKIQSQLTGEYDAMSIMAAVLKTLHALEMVETQGPGAYLRYIEKLKDDKTRAAKELVPMLPEPPKGEHPKLEKLVKILKKEPLPAIVFANFRDQVNRVVEELNEQGLNATKFVGQRKGMTQKQQKQIVEDFRDGKYEVLVSTSVGEEGIDMPSVGTLVFYEPVPSGIRHIQRRGRLRKGGKVFVLVTKGTKEEAFYYVAKAREKKMVRLLKGMSPKKITQAKLIAYDEDAPHIVVDDREISIAKYLKNVKIQRIEIGDFILSDRVAVERKTAADFVSSIVDGRLFSQAAKMKEAYEKPLIIIEGFDLFSHRGVHPNAIRGALASITLDWGIPIIVTKNQEETAKILEIISKREHDKGHKPAIHRPKATTTEEYQELLVSSLPGINLVLSRRLLEMFGSPAKLFGASLYDLMNVEGIGDKKANQIKKVLESIYESNNGS